MTRVRSALVLALLLILPASGQQTTPVPRVVYTLFMSRPASHLFEVTMQIDLPDNPSAIDLQMPRWQPGRYSVADFAKNVQEFAVKSGSVTLPFSKSDDQTWHIDVRGHRTITAAYKVFGNDLSGTFAQLDGTHGNINGGEVFMYVAGHKQDPVELRLTPPTGWRAINGASERPTQLLWKYPNYELLIDSPTEVGPDWTLDEFQSGGKTYRVVVHSRGPEGNLRPRLVQDIRKVVEAEVAMWGTPEFDRYTFLLHYAADPASRDGMEHLNSTQIIRSGVLADPGVYEDTLANVAHEFFHLWNVKRLRPVALGPWDWTRPPFTPSLWVAEGLTQYYGNLMMRRARIWDDGRFLGEMENTISDVENAPGNTLMSAVDASLASAFIDSPAHRQQTNFENATVSYYTKGELIGMVLDLTIRGRTNGRRSLDDVLKQLYDELYVQSPNASYYLHGRGYTDADFVRVLSRVAGSDMQDFYNRYILGTEPLPYNAALAYAGLRLVRTPAETFSLGIYLDYADPQLPRLGVIQSGSSAEAAGLQRGDILLTVDGASVDHDSWYDLIHKHRQGDRVPIRVRRYGKTVDLVLTLGPAQQFDYRFEPLTSATAAAKALRTAWLSGS